MLIPCGGCRRHVRSSEPACPFCGAAIEAAPPRSSLAGRFSRAAVFAGLASCASSPPVQHAPPPPPDDRRVEEPPPPPPDDRRVEEPDEQTYAKPPDDTTKAAVATGGIQGTVRDHRGRPVPSFDVDLGGGQSVMTDGQGSYRFENLAPGRYQLLVRTSNNPRHGPTQRSVEVKSGTVVRADIQLPAPVVDRGPCCKPYGAPPARRRIV